MIEIVEQTPTVQQYQEIIKAVGFRGHDPAAVETALKNSIFAACAIDNDEVVGLGRIVGDGAISFLLTNVIVHPSYQRQGIGSRIVEKLCGLMDSLPYKNVVLEAVPLPGLESFYERCGFKSSRGAPPGMVRWFNRVDV